MIHHIALSQRLMAGLMLAVLGSFASFAHAAGFSTTGSMATARVSHTATLLPSGQVLVAGGSNGSGSLATAELYDPATGNWLATGDMITARDNHTATLLPSGKVLVAGGSNSGGALASAELYDPATGNWTATGDLNTARYKHTATLLPSGQVLVEAGNASVVEFLASAELYDPATGTWTVTDSIYGGRDAYTATLLPSSGQVLVAGGLNRMGSPVSLEDAQLYDGTTQTWARTGAMNGGRAAHTATLLPSGQVLVTGGGLASNISPAPNSSTLPRGPGP
ncbi:MAG: kelch repeat-containing protein [Rhodanobacteraceae bacterium]